MALSNTLFSNSMKMKTTNSFHVLGILFLISVVTINSLAQGIHLFGKLCLVTCCMYVCMYVNKRMQYSIQYVLSNAYRYIVYRCDIIVT